MAVVYSEIEAQVLTLPPDQRSALMAKLLDSLDGDSEDSPEAIAAAWDVEIARRVEEFEAGHSRDVPWEEVHAMMRAKVLRPTS